MTQTVERVECKGRGKDRLFGKLGPLWLTRNELNDVCAAKGGRSEEICEGKPVKDWMPGQISTRVKKWIEKGERTHGMKVQHQ